MRPNTITSPEFQQRFWSHTHRTSSGCLEWQMSRDKLGYGYIKADGKTRKAHRVAYQLVHSPIPDGLPVLHTCDNPACCESTHLFLGSHLDNMRDKTKKDRQARGEHLPQSKLNAQKVREIRRRYTEDQLSLSQLAKDYGVHLSTIWDVVQHNTWRHIA